MATRAFINFPATQFMTDFEIIHVGNDIIQYNRAKRNQIHNNLNIPPVHIPHVEEHIQEEQDYIQLPEIPEDNPGANVRHISFNIEQVHDDLEDITLDSSNSSLFDKAHALENLQNNEIIDENIDHQEDNDHNSSDIVQDDSHNKSTPDNSNDDSFKSLLESPMEQISLNNTPHLEPEEIEELHRVVHSTTTIRNTDEHFVNIFNLMSNTGPIISAVSPNFAASYINDYFVCHLCHSNSKQNQDWNQEDQDLHPCIRTVAGMFIHLYETHIHKQKKDREISVPCENFVLRQIFCLRYGYSNPLFNTKMSITKSASTSMMDNSWTSKDSWASKRGKVQITNLRKDMKHVFDDIYCSGHSIIHISKDAEFYDLAHSIYCVCNKEELDETIPKLTTTTPGKSPTFSIFKSLDKTQRTLFGSSPIKGTPPPRLPYKTFPVSKPITRSQTKVSKAMQTDLTVSPSAAPACELEGDSIAARAKLRKQSTLHPLDKKGKKNE